MGFLSRSPIFLSRPPSLRLGTTTSDEDCEEGYPASLTRIGVIQGHTSGSPTSAWSQEGGEEP